MALDTLIPILSISLSSLFFLVALENQVAGHTFQVFCFIVILSEAYSLINFRSVRTRLACSN